MKARKLTEAVKKQTAHLQQWRCKSCQSILPPTYQVDHVIPHAVFSDDSLDNLQALCPNCHSRKTQAEHMRIIRYKKKRALAKCQLCWFCLEPVDESMTCCCDRTLKNITFKTKKMSLINAFDQFCYVEPKIPEKAPDTVLRITLERDKVTINSRVFHFQTEYDLPDVVKCVLSATKMKRWDKFFTEVEINVDFGEEPNTTEGLVEYLDTHIPSRLPARLFVEPNDVVYTFLIES